MDNAEKAYSPKEISITLDIGDSTLRKWCLAMEKNGYGFIRNEQNTRIFVDRDLVVLRHFQNLVKQHNMQLENAAKLVIDRFGKGAFEVGTGIVLAEKEEEQRDLTRSNEMVINALLEHIKSQEEFNRELVKEVSQLRKSFEERFTAMENDRALITDLRDSMKETQQQYQLQIAAAQEEKEQPWYKKIFGK